MIWNRVKRALRGTPPLLASRADVATDSPERFAKQLASHLGHKISIESTPEGDVYSFDDGHGVVRAGDGVLVLTAVGQGAEALAVIQDVIGRHLLKFGTKAGLTVTWSEAQPVKRTRAHAGSHTGHGDGSDGGLFDSSDGGGSDGGGGGGGGGGGD